MVCLQICRQRKLTLKLLSPFDKVMKRVEGGEVFLAFIFPSSGVHKLSLLSGRCVGCRECVSSHGHLSKYLYWLTMKLIFKGSDKRVTEGDT